MKFSASLISLFAAAGSVAAKPFGSLAFSANFAPVPVNKLTCDGDSLQCTASLDFGDGNWVAQWSASVFHTGSLIGTKTRHDMSAMSMAPVPVTTLECDGASFLCTANLDFGDGNWVAQWPTAVFQQNSFLAFNRKEAMSMDPVPVTTLQCDGSSFKCTANLDFGSGNWVAQWSTAVFHNNNFFLKQN